MLRYATYALLTVTLAANLVSSAATGNIGCLFSETLCNPEKEWCYNDFAFGKCLSLYGNVHQEDLKGVRFGAKDLHTLEREMQRLFLLGYRWSHAYTQCVLQAVLFSIRNKSDLDISKCSVELENDLEGALKVIEGEEMEQIDPRNLAIVRFTPSVANPHSAYADEFYFPPVEEMLPPFNGNGENKQLKEGEDGGRTKEGGEKGHKDNGKEEGEREVLKEGNHVEEKEYQSKSKGPLKVSSTTLPEYEEDNKIPLESFPRHELEELSYLPMDEIPDDQVFLPDDYDSHNENLALPPPAIPMSLYLEDDEDVKPSPYDSLTENDYDYDLLFHSPYATPPRITSLYKRNMGALREIVEPYDRREGGIEALVGTLFRKSDSKPGSVKDWARMLSNHRSTNRGLSPKPRQDYVNGEKIYIPPPEAEPSRNFNGQRLRSGNVGYFQEHPIIPTFREREQLEEQPTYYSPYNREYSHYYQPELQSQIPVLTTPNPDDDKDHSPETLHPPYIKSDYEERPVLKIYENGVSRFDKDSKPIVGGFDSNEDQADQEEKENSYSSFKESHKDYKPSYINTAIPMGTHLSQDAYYGRPDYAYNFNAYEYGDYPYYYDYGPDYVDMAGQPPSWNFHRDERLDVKKPGPFFKSDNDFAFDYKGNEDYTTGGNDWMGEMNDGDEESMLLAKLRESQGLNKDGTRIADEKGRQDVPDLLLTEEGYVDAASDESHRRHFSKGFPKAAYMVSAQNALHGHEKDPRLTSPPPKEPDTYVYIITNGRFHSQGEGEQIVHLILRLSGLDINDIGSIKVEDSQIMFQLLPKNSKGMTASHLANAISKLRNEIKEKTDIEIVKAGVGTKSAMSSVIYSSSQRQMLAAAAIVCGVCAALLVAATTLFFLRRNSKSKAKLQGIAAHDSEASKDYQDLCRARMAGKGDGKDPLAAGPGHAHPIGSTGSGHAPGQRISSLSKESDNGNNSPSSRSSTSSWSEEPVMTNMDISTGHMVLSYMEDHLRNKDRLEQEWVALCAYEAEPCASNFALKPENAQKNRYPDVLPYDHNRVILNEHANVSGSSYINASSITDHDPRNPAYIATQGPLASTAADFWQLVWEQGSVVIVMLTRLTENGQALCHRYWPEEGSELYHIYEVHLVSEHIWCDDYLVRSFYLKNARTGETRTVTQFHFLSWPESGIPASTKALLEFRRKVNKSYRGRSCPIIVHCSDGVGRTGTYCLIDMVLNRMSKGAKEIDIAATLEHIRDQRPNMVKTKGQFEFVLMSVAEEVHAILKALPQ